MPKPHDTHEQPFGSRIDVVEHLENDHGFREPMTSSSSPHWLNTDGTHAIRTSDLLALHRELHELVVEGSE